MARQPIPAPVATGTALLLAGVLLTLAVSSLVAFRGWPGLSSSPADGQAAAVMAAVPAPAEEAARTATLGGRRAAAGAADRSSDRAAARRRRARSPRPAGAGASRTPRVARLPAPPRARLSPAPSAPRGAPGDGGATPRVAPSRPAPVPAPDAGAADRVPDLVGKATGVVDDASGTDLGQRVGNLLLGVRDLLP